MILLASASPRRRMLLAEAGLAFAVEPLDVDESIDPATPPVQAAQALARRKAEAALARHAGEHLWIVAADTVVALGDDDDARLLGKPADAEEARSTLLALAGTRHRVATGVAVARASDGELAVASEVTFVTMRRIEPAEVDAYVASGGWRDKAGGYGIQDADSFVTGLEEGGFDNVVGLPVALTLELLRRLGAPV